MQDHPHVFPSDVQNIYEFVSSQSLRPQLTDLRREAMAWVRHCPPESLKKRENILLFLIKQHFPSYRNQGLKPLC